MKQKIMENEVMYANVKKGIPQLLQVTSPTKQEIANYWEKKRAEEEDHLLAAKRAVARIRAKKLLVKYSAYEDNYKPFGKSFKEDYHGKEIDKNAKTSGEEDEKNEIRIGIKDWWTQSKYAYLNQPAIN